MPISPSVALGTGLLYASHGHSGKSQNGASAAFVAGLSIAPSTGHLYAGEYGHALLTTMARAAAGGLAVWAFMSSVPKDCSPGECHNGLGNAGPILALFLALLVPAVAVYDIADAPRAAARANQAHSLEMGLTPVIAYAGPTPSSGLALDGRF